MKGSPGEGDVDAERFLFGQQTRTGAMRTMCLAINKAARANRRVRMEMATAVSRSASIADITARVNVCVRPGRFPANIMVAPNSESERAQAKIVPATRAGRASGMVTVQNTRHDDEPNVCATSSSVRFTPSKPARAALT